MTRPDRRSVLETLTKARLLQVAERFSIEVASGRPKKQVVEALVAARRATLDDLLAAFTMDELRAACRQHALDDDGRAKQVLVDRLAGREATAAREAGPAYVAKTTKPEPEPVEALRRKVRKSRRQAGDAKPDALAEVDDESGYAPETKSRLRRFVLAAAGGYTGRDAAASFARDLIACFGWHADEELPAQIPAAVSVVDRGTRRERFFAAMLHERRSLVEVVDRDRGLTDAWSELMPLVLQIEPTPQYVVLTNQRDVALYDVARSRTEPRLPALALDQLPKYSEAFPFLARDWSPGATPKILNGEKVSKEVADLVARVYRSFKQEHPNRQDDVIRFTLQCIIAMFAEDIGLLPREYFTSLLYQAAEHGDAEKRLGELFRTMSTPGGASRAIRYFNGGLFRDPVVLPIGRAQLAALTRAAEKSWSDVDPHIFGSVFQGIMDHAERHASGAHYTAKEDILRVVGPTIVEPWRKRIVAATTLAELRALRSELVEFRVLDPACGSGNFLYIAFREMYRLETEILARMREFPSVADDPKGRAAWGSGIPTTNFFGIDINPFAVELARATLNIAKKIAFDERRQIATEKFGQVELELDPSLPLDNLEKNIVCADALFVEWPAVEAIVGNPPMLGDRKIRAELGQQYLDRLRETTGVDGVVDLSCYWFRRAQDRLQPSGRAGLVGTSGLRIGKAREAALDYIVQRGGTITNAVSSMIWPGDAALNVCMVNWINGRIDGPCQLTVDGRSYARPQIATHLQLHVDVSEAKKLDANKQGTAMGVIFGSDAFTSGGDEGFSLTQLRSLSCVRPVASATPMLTGTLAQAPKYCIDLTSAETQAEAERIGGAAFRHLKKKVYPMVQERATSGAETEHYARWIQSWWRPHWPRSEFFDALDGKRRIIACSNPQARPIFTFISSAFVPTNTLQVFALDDDYSFGVIQSAMHWAWTKAKGGKVTERIRYTSDVWRTFPWSQQPNVEAVANVAAAARSLREARRDLMARNGWSLRALYQAADVAGPHPLKDAQAHLDTAVAAVYQMPPDQEPLEFLLELNLLLAEDEAEGRPICGPGLPSGFDPHDPRWYSTDCIEPPSLDAPKEDRRA